ncbi:MAG: DUF333 domain-containing protein, partial [Candidatus Pacebacteria bacterium]|nr:DUF333 domain-containing protein [Candidatus Paceibacterota bacterium]
VPTEYKKEIIKLQNDVFAEQVNSAAISPEQKQTIQGYITELKNAPEYKQVVLEDIANEIISNNQQEFSQLSQLSAADQEKLTGYMQTILTEKDLNFENAINGLNSLNISSEGRALISEVQNKILEKITVSDTNTNAGATSATGLANPASTFCIGQGYKLEIRKDAQGNETGYCMFADGKECEEWSFYRGQCGSGYIKN